MKIVYSLLGVFLLFGCSEESVKENVVIKEKIESNESNIEAETNNKDDINLLAVSGIALGIPGHKDLESLVQDTESIIMASMLSGYDVIENPIKGENQVYFIDYNYKISVDKTLKDQKKNKFKKGDTVDLIVSVGMSQKLNGKFGELVPLSDNRTELSTGDYLFFLEYVYYEPLKKNVMMISNNNHIYKKEGKEYHNIGSDLVPVIEENIEF